MNDRLLNFVLCYLLITLVISTRLTLASSYIAGKSQYKMGEAQTLSFTKSYLHYLAYRDVISQELGKLGLDATSFWTKYDNAFALTFQEHEQRYQKALAETISDEAKAKVLASKKEYRLSKQKNYAGISHVIISDAIKSFGSKLGNPQIKTMRIEAKVNYKALRKLYSRFMIDTLVTKSFQEVVLKAKFDWGNVNFPRLGEMSKDQIEVSILRGWKDWFIQNTNIEHPVLVYLESEVPEKNQLNRDMNRASLFINIIAREGGRGRMIYPIHYQVSLALKDEETNNFVFLKDISNLKKVYKADADEGRRFANDVFSAPIPYLVAVRTLLEKSILTNQEEEVSIRNYKNIDDVLKIQDKLKTLGISFNLIPSLRYFESSNASLNIRHNGTKGQLKAILAKVQNIFFPIEFIMTDNLSDPVPQVL